MDFHLLTPAGAELIMQTEGGKVILPPSAQEKTMDEIEEIPPNPDLIQDRGRLRLEDLLEKGKRELLDQPPVDTTEIPPQIF